MRGDLRRVLTPTLEIAYEETGAPDGAPVILLHGFPYDVRAYDGVVAALKGKGFRFLVPYLRGYGPTRILDPNAQRSGQQAGLGSDLLDFMDALHLPPATLVGYDWGGRAACIVAALHSDRVRGLVSGVGYNIQNIARAGQPVSAEEEHRYWYQYYFHSERGRLGLEKNRRDLCRYIWKIWSPNWNFTDAEFEASAGSFDNPDFVEIVAHSYRHRFGYAPGAPVWDSIEKKLAAQPAITVPTIVLHGEADGVDPIGPTPEALKKFSDLRACRIIPIAGHNFPQEAPAPVAAAIEELLIAQ